MSLSGFLKTEVRKRWHDGYILHLWSGTELSFENLHAKLVFRHDSVFVRWTFGTFLLFERRLSDRSALLDTQSSGVARPLTGKLSFSSLSPLARSRLSSAGFHCEPVATVVPCGCFVCVTLASSGASVRGQRRFHRRPDRHQGPRLNAPLSLCRIWKCKSVEGAGGSVQCCFEKVQLTKSVLRG